MTKLKTPVENLFEKVLRLPFWIYHKGNIFTFFLYDKIKNPC
jgi:hypothetical protein